METSPLRHTWACRCDGCGAQVFVITAEEDPAPLPGWTRVLSRDLCPRCAVAVEPQTETRRPPGWANALAHARAKLLCASALNAQAAATGEREREEHADQDADQDADEVGVLSASARSSVAGL